MYLVIRDEMSFFVEPSSEQEVAVQIAVTKKLKYCNTAPVDYIRTYIREEENKYTFSLHIRNSLGKLNRIATAGIARHS